MQTGEFRMTRGTLLSYLYRKHGKGWTIGLSVGFIILAVWSIVASDLRFAILALIYLFVLIPMVMVFLYLNHALKPDVCFNALPHSIRLLSDGSLEVCIPPKEESDTESDDRKKPELKTMIIPSENIGKYEIGNDEIIIQAKSRQPNGPDGFIYLPLSAFTEPQEMKMFIEKLYAHTDS